MGPYAHPVRQELKSAPRVTQLRTAGLGLFGSKVLALMLGSAAWVLPIPPLKLFSSLRRENSLWVMLLD